MNWSLSQMLAGFWFAKECLWKSNQHEYRTNFHSICGALWWFMNWSISRQTDLAPLHCRNGGEEQSADNGYWPSVYYFLTVSSACRYLFWETKAHFSSTGFSRLRGLHGSAENPKSFLKIFRDVWKPSQHLLKRFGMAATGIYSRPCELR